MRLEIDHFYDTGAYSHPITVNIIERGMQRSRRDTFDEGTHTLCQSYKKVYKNYGKISFRKSRTFL